MHRSDKSNRPKKVAVAYDPNFADEIYLFHTEGSREHWVCRITDLSREFRGLTFWEVWRKQQPIKIQSTKDKLESDKLRMHHENRVENIISSAIKQTPKSTSTKKERMKGVGYSRSQQLLKEREQRRPKRPVYQEQEKVVHLTTHEDNDDYPDFEDELFNEGDD
jgi:hypothetical protein